jgi:glc operon protein GlcG
MTTAARLLGLAAVTLAGVAPASATTPAASPLSELAFANAAIAACRVYAAEHKYPPLSVAVLDASGALVAFSRADGAGQLSADVALIKARSALRIGAPTAVMTEPAAKDPTLIPLLQQLGLTAMPGGVPIVEDGKVVGAVGASGAEPVDDARCAAAGAAVKR